MDAREYLARKGLDGERDRERPNTLEEKAWSRAREASDHRPRAGTPHDWEDWERYHDVLAEGAESLEQKIDQEAHRRALEHEGGGVEHFTPRAGDQVRVTAAEPTTPSDEIPSTEIPSTEVPARPEPYAALLALAVLLPPLAMGLAGGGARRLAIALGLTLLGWVPGVVYVIHWLRRA
ncbi:YqaE/Pmp3 family membrane protein [Halomonas nitroreducens]|uniref:YqaE/Pmp3 family membrane protein n=1 Tax=Halomonas nitroreducens TaxID=447425 RepID=A0A3S0R0X4_9GAMM|nr:YqaE/Pmp3 family membrane protein [Halomonas nitroreducens]RTR02395.1 YqaE/Pmp3 family membrane protein [Halomonas nitroreducens]